MVGSGSLTDTGTARYQFQKPTIGQVPQTAFFEFTASASDKFPTVHFFSLLMHYGSVPVPSSKKPSKYRYLLNILLFLDFINGNYVKNVSICMKYR